MLSIWLVAFKHPLGCRVAKIRNYSTKKIRNIEELWPLQLWNKKNSASSELQTQNLLSLEEMTCASNETRNSYVWFGLLSMLFNKILSNDYGHIGKLREFIPNNLIIMCYYIIYIVWDSFFLYLIIFNIKDLSFEYNYRCWEGRMK